MSILQTAERSSHLDPSENVIFQRHLRAYKEALKMISGTVLEIGCGEGYGIIELSEKSNKFIALDKYFSESIQKTINKDNVVFKQLTVPPLTGIDDNSIDYVVTFQVIEHIKDDEVFIEEIYRVLKPGGILILTTPNLLMSLSRNPWHIREYHPEGMREILQTSFQDITLKGVYGNDKVMKYYEANSVSVNKLRKWDFLNLEKNLPRWMLQIPYDILNRFNRHGLQDNNMKLVNEMKYTDYDIKDLSDDCLDFFCIAKK
tara:strand:+ start:5212 stop:5988 length:777 start_codon:yes stop_codon:yes gene_type:complete